MINPKLIVYNEILNPFEYLVTGHTLFILDDCFLEPVKDRNTLTAFSKEQRKNILSIAIIQNLFP